MSDLNEPISTETLKALVHAKNTWYMGFQGDRNSCYMDATLFSMFGMCNSFDYALDWPIDEDANPIAVTLQGLLKQMVHELRSNGYVEATSKRSFRKNLARFFQDQPFQDMEWIGSENDPAEFIEALFDKVLGIPPFIPTSTGTHVLNLWPDRTPIERRLFATYQNVVDSDRNNMVLNGVPENLILKLPLIGETEESFRHWMKNMVPSLTLDITDHINSAVRQCCICGIAGSCHCSKCFGIFGENRSSEYFCTTCIKKCHEIIDVDDKFANPDTDHFTHYINYESGTRLTNIPPRIIMHLHAVICFKQHHYTCFVRGGTRKDATWFYYDSMGCRDDEGMCVPTIKPVYDFSTWCRSRGIKDMLMKIKTGKMSELVHKMREVELSVMQHQIICNPTILFYNNPKKIYV